MKPVNPIIETIAVLALVAMTYGFMDWFVDLLAQ